MKDPRFVEVVDAVVHGSEVVPDTDGAGQQLAGVDDAVGGDGVQSGAVGTGGPQDGLPDFDAADYERKLSKHPKVQSKKQIEAVKPKQQQKRKLKAKTLAKAPHALTLKAKPVAATKASGAQNAESVTDPLGASADGTHVFNEEDQAKKFVMDLEKDIKQTRNAIDNIEDKLVTMKRNEGDIKRMLKTIVGKGGNKRVI